MRFFVHKMNPLLVPVLIVKNEESSIIDTIIPFLNINLDKILIVDTGSTDNTINIITEYKKEFENITLIEEPFVDFSTTRNFALTKAKELFDPHFLIMPDAEWILQNGDKLLTFLENNLEELFFKIIINENNCVYPNIRIINSKKIENVNVFQGEIHEGIYQNAVDIPSEIYFKWNYNSKGLEKSRKRWETDIIILNKNLTPRNIFYLAQTYFHLNDYENAIIYYNQRVNLNENIDEIYYSYFQLGIIYKSLEQINEAVHNFLKAYVTLPIRAEPLIYMSMLSLSNLNINKLFIEQSLKMEIPFGSLFVNLNLYLKRHTILANICYKLQEYEEAHKNVIEAFKYEPEDPQVKNLAELINSKVKIEKIKKNIEIDTITIAILAKDKAHTLPLYLNCILNQTWPKNKTYLYIRSNNNNDNTIEILEDFLSKYGHLYGKIYKDYSDTPEKVQDFKQHQWNALRFSVLGKIRKESCKWAYNENTHYFVVDCDNFIKQNTLEKLYKTNLQIVAPFMKIESKANTMRYSNFHAAVNETGYFKEDPLFDLIYDQKIKGIIEVPVVHCAYFIRHEILNRCKYQDYTTRYEYVIFSDFYRVLKIPQYIDCRELYGYITFAETSEQLENFDL